MFLFDIGRRLSFIDKYVLNYNMYIASRMVKESTWAGLRWRRYKLFKVNQEPGFPRPILENHWYCQGPQGANLPMAIPPTPEPCETPRGSWWS
jgi:hypothetical protein